MVGAVQPGDVLDGKYAIERIIGRGGAGYVAAARHLVLQRRVALKFLRPELSEDPELARRFLREGQAAARMKGEHVAHVLDADTLPSGQPYLVMEYLEGEDVAALLRRCGPLAVEQATDFLLQACEAVHEAHTLRIIHRDLKPANMFLTRTPGGGSLIKVLDFGLSKVLDGEGRSDSITDSHHVVGSPHFMSPEQIRTPREIDERTDVWSLGATLFDLLTGHVPFDGRSMMEVCAALLCGPPPSIGRFRTDVPRELEAAVLRCLRIDPAERHPSVMELARALAPFAPHDPQACLARMASAGSSEARDRAGAIAPPAPEPPMDSPMTAGRRSHRVRLLAAGAAAVALAGIATALRAGAPVNATQETHRPAPTDPAPPLALHGPDAARVQAALLRPDDTHDPRRDFAGSVPRMPLLRETADGLATAVPYGRALEPKSTPVRRAGVDVSASHDRWTAPPPVLSVTAPAPPRPDCRDPFYIDGQGIKAIRSQCL
jgi:eukaryotic-like serine/threonine-protein kinase